VKLIEDGSAALDDIDALREGELRAVAMLYGQHIVCVLEHDEIVVGGALQMFQGAGA
jgi:hypothetical protein